MGAPIGEVCAGLDILANEVSFEGPPAAETLKGPTAVVEKLLVTTNAQLRLSVSNQTHLELALTLPYAWDQSLSGVG